MMMDIAIWLFIVLLVVAILAGAIGGFFFARKYFKKLSRKESANQRTND